MKRFVIAAAVAALLTSAPSTAGAAAPKLKAEPSFGGDRLVVTVTSPRAFTARTRPRSVEVTIAGARYTLRAASRTARRSVWRTGKLGAQQLAALYGKKATIRIGTRAGTVKRQRQTPPAPPPAVPGGGTTPTAPGGPAAGTPPATPGVTLTRNDDAGRQALAGGDLLLERAESGSVTMTYYRLFLYGNGTFDFQKADWNQVSGEICDSAAKRTGTWTFKEAYTFPERGGGVLVKLATVAGGQAGEELFAFSNADPSHVWVGANLVQFDVNPNMRNQC